MSSLLKNTKLVTYSYQNIITRLEIAFISATCMYMHMVTNSSVLHCTFGIWIKCDYVTL